MSSQEGKFTFIFGSVIAFILLGIYAGTVGFVIFNVIACAGDVSCSNYSAHDGVVYVITTTNGLVSALVIAKLSIVDPTEQDINKIYSLVSGMSQVKNTSLVFKVTIGYLVIWLIIGLSTLIFGVLLFPEINQTLGDLGSTWLGLAVAAGYTFLGIKPK